jgi:hypothetical protein
MNADTLMPAVRYTVIGFFMFLAGRGTIDKGQAVAMADQVMTVGYAAIALGTAAYGLYVRWGTRAVPEATAARKDVPTVNPVTGSVIPGAKS